MNEEEESQLRQAIIEAMNSEDRRTKVERNLVKNICEDCSNELECFSDPRNLNINGPTAKICQATGLNGKYYELVFREDLNANYLHVGDILVIISENGEGDPEQLTQLVENGNYNLQRYA